MLVIPQFLIKKEIDTWIMESQQTEIKTILENYRKGYCSSVELLWVVAKMLEAAYQAGYTRQLFDGAPHD